MRDLPIVCFQTLRWIEEDEHRPGHSDADGRSWTAPIDGRGGGRSAGPDALAILKARGLIEPNLIGFGVGTGPLFRNPCAKGAHLLTQAGRVALLEQELLEAEDHARESEVVDEETDAAAMSWLDRLRVALARRGPQFDKDGRRRWRQQDVADDAGVHRSTISRSPEAVRLLRAAKTARTRAGRAEAEGDHL